MISRNFRQDLKIWKEKMRKAGYTAIPRIWTAENELVSASSSHQNWRCRILTFNRFWHFHVIRLSTDVTLFWIYSVRFVNKMHLLSQLLKQNNWLSLRARCHLRYIQFVIASWAEWASIPYIRFYRFFIADRMWRDPKKWKTSNEKWVFRKGRSVHRQHTIDSTKTPSSRWKIWKIKSHANSLEKSRRFGNSAMRSSCRRTGKHSRKIK